MSDTSIATVNSSGLVSALSAGSVTVDISYNGQNDSATITVNPVPVTLQAINVTTPVSTSVVGTTLPLTATGSYSDSSTDDLSNSVTWSVSDPAIASINNSGLLTAISPGMVTVTAVDGTVSDSVTVNVDPVPVTLQSIAVTPTNNNLVAGNTVQLTATGSYSDSSTANITSSVTWSVSDPAIATVDNNGLVTSLSDGSVTVTATSGALINSVTVNVDPVPVTLQSIAVTPTNNNLAAGNTCLLYTSPSPRDATLSRMPSSA